MGPTIISKSAEFPAGVPCIQGGMCEHLDSIDPEADENRPLGVLHAPMGDGAQPQLEVCCRLVDGGTVWPCHGCPLRRSQ